jgi:glycosyltransferase involved in cell wall biosynthesis
MYEHKNTQGMIDAYKILKEKYGYTGQYVLASKKDKFSKKVYDQIKKAGLENDILVLAYKVDSEDKFVVSDQETINLRSKADLYMFAPFTEGFSLTAMEGMVQGLPAVLSNIDCHKEIYDDSVPFVDPYSPEDIAQKANELLTNSKLKEDYIKRGYEQIKKYDWLKTAQITLDVFKNV